MSVVKNSAQIVSEKDGVDTQSVVNHQKMSFGFAVKTAYHQNLCANFHPMMLNNLLKNEFLFSEVILIILSVSIVKDLFPAMKSWISKNIFQFARKKHGIEEKWSEMIEISCTPEFYKAVLIENFVDKNYSFGRIYIVTIFTENICRKHPEISEEIQTVFLQFIREIK